MPPKKNNTSKSNNNDDDDANSSSNSSGEPAPLIAQVVVIEGDDTFWLFVSDRDVPTPFDSGSISGWYLEQQPVVRGSIADQSGERTYKFSGTAGQSNTNKYDVPHWACIARDVPLRPAPYPQLGAWILSKDDREWLTKLYDDFRRTEQEREQEAKLQAKKQKQQQNQASSSDEDEDESSSSSGDEEDNASFASKFVIPVPQVVDGWQVQASTAAAADGATNNNNNNKTRWIAVCRIPHPNSPVHRAGDFILVSERRNDPSANNFLEAFPANCIIRRVYSPVLSPIDAESTRRSNNSIVLQKALSSDLDTGNRTATEEALVLAMSTDMAQPNPSVALDSGRYFVSIIAGRVDKPLQCSIDDGLLVKELDHDEEVGAVVQHVFAHDMKDGVCLGQLDAKELRESAVKAATAVRAAWASAERAKKTQQDAASNKGKKGAKPQPKSKKTAGRRRGRDEEDADLGEDEDDDDEDDDDEEETSSSSSDGDDDDDESPKKNKGRGRPPGAKKSAKKAAPASPNGKKVKKPAAKGKKAAPAPKPKAKRRNNVGINRLLQDVPAVIGDSSDGGAAAAAAAVAAATTTTLKTTKAPAPKAKGKQQQNKNNNSRNNAAQLLQQLTEEEEAEKERRRMAAFQALMEDLTADTKDAAAAAGGQQSVEYGAFGGGRSEMPYGGSR